MDNVSRYGYINAKLRARIGAMTSSSLLDSMIKAVNLSEAVSLLAGTRYDALNTVYAQTADLQLVELELFKMEINEHQDIISVLDAEPASFVTTMLEKSEVENIKNALRLWYSANILHHGISYRSAYIYKDRIVNEIDWLRIINALSFEDVHSAFRHTVYEEVFSSYSEDKIAKEGLFDLEIDLDHFWFSRLFKAIDHLNSSDREVAHKIYSVDVDLKNIINLIRFGFFHDFTHEKLAHVFISYGSLYETLEKKIMSQELTFDDARAIIKRKYPVVNDLLGQAEGQNNTHSQLAYGTVAMEKYLNERRRNEYARILSGDPFTIGTILSYLNLCRSTGNTIKAILSAKYYKWSEEQIRREMN